MSGFNNSVVGGQGVLVRESIHSPDYVPGVSGWTINRDGSAEFNNIVFRGTLISTDPVTGQMIKISAGEIILDNDTVNASIFANSATGLKILSNSGVAITANGGPVTLTGDEVDVVGPFAAANYVVGKVSITPTPNVPTSAHITYTMPAGVANVIGLVTAQTGVPGTTVLGAGITNMTTTAADVFVTRTNNTATTVFYLIIGTP